MAVRRGVRRGLMTMETSAWRPYHGWTDDQVTCNYPTTEPEELVNEDWRGGWE